MEKKNKKAKDFIDEFITWLKESPCPEAVELIGFKEASLKEYENASKELNISLPPGFLSLIEERGRFYFILNELFMETCDPHEDVVAKNAYWHIGTPAFNGVVIASPSTLINGRKDVLFALKDRCEWLDLIPIATTRGDFEEGWVLDLRSKTSKNEYSIAPYNMDSLFEYDDTLENNKAPLTDSILGFDNWIGVILNRYQRAMQQANPAALKEEIKATIEYGLDPE